MDQTLTHSRADWLAAADELDRGWPHLPLSTGTMCRIAPQLADHIRASLADRDDDGLPVSFAFDDWDVYLTINTALHAIAGRDLLA